MLNDATTCGEQVGTGSAFFCTAMPSGEAPCWLVACMQALVPGGRKYRISDFYLKVTMTK